MYVCYHVRSGEKATRVEGKRRPKKGKNMGFFIRSLLRGEGRGDGARIRARGNSVCLHSLHHCSEECHTYAKCAQESFVVVAGKNDNGTAPATTTSAKTMKVHAYTILMGGGLALPAERTGICLWASTTIRFHPSIIMYEAKLIVE